MKGYCDICNTEIEVQMCCSGADCSCMGMPISPPVCSEKCYILYMANIHGEDWLKKYNISRRNDKLDNLKNKIT